MRSHEFNCDCSAITLLPLNGRRRFGSYVVNYAVDVFALVDYSDADFFQHVVRHSEPVGSHSVNRRNCAKRQGVVVRTHIAHNANAFHVGEHGEVLPYFVVEADFCHLVAKYEVRVAKNIQFFFCDVAGIL